MQAKKAGDVTAHANYTSMQHSIVWQTTFD